MPNVYRYTKELQYWIQAKINAEPWMHVIFCGGKYAIYVWDTRQILETGAGKLHTGYLKGKLDLPVAVDNHKPLIGEDAMFFNATFFGIFEFKQIIRNGRREVCFYTINGIEICTTAKYKEMFCRLDKHGRPSNLREVSKWAYSTIYNAGNIYKIFGNLVKWDYRNEYPDLTYGYTGHRASKTEILNAIQQFRNDILEKS